MSIELEFKPISEPWTIYELQDGNLLKVRVIMTSATDTGKKDPKGRPVYDLEFQTVSRVVLKDNNKEGLA